jgi:predicted ATPase
MALLPDRTSPGRFPFTLPFLAGGDFRLEFERPITFLVGENGSGKSTLLEAIVEAIADHCGFSPHGGHSEHRLSHRFRSAEGDAEEQQTALSAALRMAWKPKVANGLFFRAESFFDVARYLDRVGSRQYRGRDLHALSHGESVLAFLDTRVEEDERNIVLLDEPEAALSPERQMALVTLLHRWHRSGRVQAIIATHAPIVMAYPEATILSLDGDEIRPIAFRDTNHYRRLKSFLDAPERYLRRLLEDEA